MTPIDRDYRLDVLRAMGYKIHTEPTYEEGYATKPGERAFRVCGWHPNRSRDAVARVEWWLCVEQNMEAELIGHLNRRYVDPRQYSAAFATAAERWAACLKVMREAGLLKE
jgi:hypothetical protein